MYSLIVIALFALMLLPLALCSAGVIKNKKAALIANIAGVAVLCIAVFAVGAFAADGDSQEAAEAAASAQDNSGIGYSLGLIAAALVTGCSCIAAGFAVSSSATAAIGALSEKPEIFGKALIFVALAEGIALYGMLISIQILSKL